MSIYLRGKSWYYDFIHRGQRYTGSFGQVSRTVAKEELARKKAEVVELRLNPAKTRKSQRFAAFAEEYLEFCHANKKPKTCTRIAGTLVQLKRFFGRKKLNEITPWQIEQYKKLRKDAELQPSTINLELAVLKSMLRRAQVWGKLVDHPGKDVKPLKGVQGKTRFLSEDEESVILAACSPVLRRAVEVGLLTGFWRQEITSLRLEDVDFAQEMVSVAACYSKNGESRTLPMGLRLKILLQEAAATRGDAPTLLTMDRGIPWTPDTFASAFRRACREAGVERLGWHVLRHTFASRLVMAGIDIRTVQELMGHKSILMTMRYAHLSRDHKRAAIETLEQRFPGKSPATFHNTPLDESIPGYPKVKAIGWLSTRMNSASMRTVKTRSIVSPGRKRPCG